MCLEAMVERPHLLGLVARDGSRCLLLASKEHGRVSEMNGLSEETTATCIACGRIEDEGEVPLPHNAPVVLHMQASHQGQALCIAVRLKHIWTRLQPGLFGACISLAVKQACIRQEADARLSCPSLKVTASEVISSSAPS